MTDQIARNEKSSGAILRRARKNAGLAQGSLSNQIHRRPGTMNLLPRGRGARNSTPPSADDALGCTSRKHGSSRSEWRAWLLWLYLRRTCPRCRQRPVSFSRIRHRRRVLSVRRRARRDARLSAVHESPPRFGECAQIWVFTATYWVPPEAQRRLL